MHIPEQLLAPSVWAPLAGVSAIGVALCARRTSATLQERQVPLLGVCGAFVFAAQMVNVPTGVGPAGHLTGGVFLAALLGPAAAALVMSCVLVVQCLLFADGGLTALGANVFNLGFVAVFLGHGLRLLLRRPLGETVATFLGAWASVVMAGSMVALEVVLSGSGAWRPWLLGMAGLHALIGVGEGLITVSALSFIRGVRPDVLEGQA